VLGIEVPVEAPEVPKRYLNHLMQAEELNKLDREVFGGLGLMLMTPEEVGEIDSIEIISDALGNDLPKTPDTGIGYKCSTMGCSPTSLNDPIDVMSKKRNKDLN
jgi:hypothetical protein